MSANLEQNEYLTAYKDADAWRSARTGGVGASEVPAILGLSSYQSAFRLWAEKSALIEPEDLSSLPRIKRGKRLEQFVAEDYAEESGHQVINLGAYSIWRMPDSRLSATVDRIILDPAPDLEHPDGNGVLECKTAHEFVRHDWDEGAPLAYQVQLQSQIAVTGYRWGVLGVLIGGDDFRYYRYDRNDELIGLILERVAAFWQCVENGAPPAPDGHVATKQALGKLYPEESGEEIELPPESIQLDILRQQADAEIKHWQKVKDEADNKLRLLLGSATTGRIGSALYTLKTVRKAAYTVKPQEYRQLRRKEVKA